MLPQALLVSEVSMGKPVVILMVFLYKRRVVFLLVLSVAALCSVF